MPTSTINIDKAVNPVTYAEFLEKYLIPNRPLLIGAGLVQDWTAFSLWVNDGKVRKPVDKAFRIPNNQAQDGACVNWDYLSTTYGSLIVNATDCTHGLDEPRTSEMSFQAVIDKWHRDDPAPLLYVKDWHLARWVSGQPTLPSFYVTPSLFADDWLNYHYCTFTNDDFRFVYIGVEGTFTPFHKDVYDSYSWSTNVFGTKLWSFWAPDDAEKKREGTKVTQGPGETMFV